MVHADTEQRAENLIERSIREASLELGQRILRILSAVTTRQKLTILALQTQARSSPAT